MKKLTEEFQRVSDIVRIGDADDVKIGYAVFVGDPNGEEGFLTEVLFLPTDSRPIKTPTKPKNSLSTFCR